MEFLSFQRDFFRNAVSEAASDPVKGFVFEKKGDDKTMGEFITMLGRHQIAVQPFKNDLNVGGHLYSRLIFFNYES